MITVPDYDIHNVINFALEYIRQDIESSLPEEDRYLYALLKGNQITANAIDTYDLYQQAKIVFARKSSQQRYLATFIGYNLERASFPTIHLLIPTENTSKQILNRGIGYEEPYKGINISRDTYTEWVDCTYQLLITSDNMNEVVLIYNVLKSWLIAFFQNIDKLGYQNLKLSGQDIIIDNLLPPANIFHRTLNLHFTYQHNSPSLNMDSMKEFKVFVKNYIVNKQEEKECECVQLKPQGNIFYKEPNS